jgi:hypothetical protein
VNCEASFRPIVMSGTQREQLCSPLKTSWGLNSSTLILDALNEAHIILLLISACFMASNYCYARDWHGAPFSKLQALPKDAMPIKKWSDRDEAWLDVVQG